MKKLYWFDFLAWIFGIIFAILGSLISINRFYQFDTFYYDFGIFDRAIWLVSQFKPPVIDHHVVGGNLIFGDHFSPALFLFSPLYWLTSRQEIIFIAQAIFAALAGVVLFFAAKKVLTQHLPLALMVQVVFYLFAGLQNAIITDFHEVTVATLPLSLMIYAILSDSKRMYTLALVWFMLYKESSFLIATGLNLYIFATKKDWRKYITIIGTLCIAYAYIVMRFIIPSFSGRFQYNVLANQTLLGALIQLYLPPIKIQTVANSLASFGYTAITTPLLWPTYLLHYAARFLSEAGTRWDIGMHYNAEIAPVYALSLILLLRRLSQMSYKAALYGSSLFVLFLSLYMNYMVLKRPFFMGINPALYKASARTVEIRNFMSILPADKRIMAQNSLAAHLTHKDVILMRDKYQVYNPDYIIFDTNPDQNGNNWFGLKDKDAFIKNVSLDPNYYLDKQISSYQLYTKK